MGRKESNHRLTHTRAHTRAHTQKHTILNFSLIVSLFAFIIQQQFFYYSNGSKLPNRITANQLPSWRRDYKTVEVHKENAINSDQISIDIV